MELKVKRLACVAKLPTKAHLHDAAFDLYTDANIIIYPNTTVKVTTGIAVEIPEGFYAQILGRSGLSSKGVHVTGGVVDAGYRGEWLVILHCTNKNGYEFSVGDKIAQFVLHEVPPARIVEVEELSETSRGDKGFGSSGA
jgi:dUTP pyrophosphatase